MADLNNVYDAWWWLINHPGFAYPCGPMRGWSGFKASLDIDFARVDPTTERVEDDKSRNTATRVWLECGPFALPEECGETQEDCPDGIPSHDYDLDCGGKTFEEAILKLAQLVLKHYGDYEEKDTIPSH